MYAGLCFSIAEMTAALPHAGGAYSFERSAVGPLGGYLGAIFGTPDSAAPFWRLAAGLAWFALVARHRLVHAPEERFALEARRRR